MDNLSRESSFNLDFRTIDTFSRESPLLSQETLEEVMVHNGFIPSDLDKIFNFKQEIMPGCLQETYSLEPESESQGMYTFNALPDSTEVSNVEPTIVRVSTSTLPSTENYPGLCDFNVEFNRTLGDKAKWQYSKSLNKLYIMMNNKIPLSFKWNQSEHDLYVRVLPIFLAQESFAEPVRRCPTHISEMELSNKDFDHVDHIVRCHHSNAIYDANAESERLSVVVPLESPQPGTDWSTVFYSLMCKNSCGLGMNRRNTALIFTLERANGEVIGRKLINVRICSCPRRDMVKEEQDLYRNNVNNESPLQDRNTEEVKFLAKKPLKRITKLVNIRVPKSFAKIIKDIIMLNKNVDELTAEERTTVEDCNKYLL